jgi:hypothetical protein
MAGIRWSHVFFLLSTWVAVSFAALMVVGLVWTARLKPQALADARAQRQEIVRVLAHLADAQVRYRLDVLEPVAIHLARSWGSHEPRSIQQELDTVRAILQMPSLFVVAPDGKPLAFSPLATADGRSNLDLRYGDRPLFQEVTRTGRPALSGILFGRATRDFIVGAAVPIRVDREIVAYLLGSIRLQASIEAIEQAAGPEGWLVMIDGDKQAIFLDRKTRQVTQQDWKSHPVVEELASRDSDGLVQIDGDDWLVAQALMPTLRVNLVLAGSVHRILQAQRAVLLTLAATLLVSLAMSLVVSTVMAIRFVRAQRATVTELNTRLATRS